ncbi:metallophosphoesterase [soil metagenome]
MARRRGRRSGGRGGRDLSEESAARPGAEGDGLRILAVADAVSSFVYTESFPHNLPAFDVVLSAGDLPGYLLEFMATKLRVPPVYVVGNHGHAYLRSADDPDEIRLPGGCINAHRRVVETGGLLIAGFEGSARYRPGPHQYSESAYRAMVAAMTPLLLLNRLRYGRAVDVLLTHAPPKGPHEGSDYPHRGVAAFNHFHRRWRPRLHVHGHVHLVGSNEPREYVSEEGVRVINAYEFALIDVARAARAARHEASPPVP